MVPHKKKGVLRVDKKFQTKTVAKKEAQGEEQIETGHVWMASRQSGNTNKGMPAFRRKRKIMLKVLQKSLN